MGDRIEVIWRDFLRVLSFVRFLSHGNLLMTIGRGTGTEQENCSEQHYYDEDRASIRKRLGAKVSLLRNVP